jgi:hypothetical protein
VQEKRKTKDLEKKRKTEKTSVGNSKVLDAISILNKTPHLKLNIN